jgi:hypothetical protein
MRFMVSLINDGSSMEGATPAQMKEMGAKMSALMGELKQAGVLMQTGALAPSATARTLRYGEEGKPVVTDGPFAESKEQIAGYMVLECEDLDAAIAWAERLPVRSSSVEVRGISEGTTEDDV